jgi:aryl-alcohol dehydrogenase-like predicted oxidoreductase
MACKDLTYCPMNDIEMGWYHESGLPVMCFGAHARGWFASRAAGQTPKESPLRLYDIFPENHRRLSRLQKLAEKLNTTLAAVCTAYVRDHCLNAVVLSSFTKLWQLEEAMEAEKFILTPDQIKYLETGVGSC